MFFVVCHILLDAFIMRNMNLFIVAAIKICFDLANFPVFNKELNIVTLARLHCCPNCLFIDPLVLFGQQNKQEIM